jgi:hypothetical protein
VTLHPRSQACVFVYSLHGKSGFPHLLWSFPPFATLTSFPAPDCWVCAAAPCGLHLPKSSGRWCLVHPGALLVSPFNVKWRFSAQAGGVEGSKFCLFSVALPAKCVSSVSPRFHFRRLAFCFLPLAAILESCSRFL